MDIERIRSVAVRFQYFGSRSCLTSGSDLASIERSGRGIKRLTASAAALGSVSTSWCIATVRSAQPVHLSLEQLTNRLVSSATFLDPYRRQREAVIFAEKATASRSVILYSVDAPPETPLGSIQPFSSLERWFLALPDAMRLPSACHAARLGEPIVHGSLGSRANWRALSDLCQSRGIIQREAMLGRDDSVRITRHPNTP